MKKSAELTFAPTAVVSPPLADGDRLVVKIGSALLTANGAGLDENAITGWAAQIAQLRNHGVQVLLVSSGAVAAGSGITAPGLQRVSDPVARKQVMAATGQGA